jgi:hypothetical protein
MLFIVFLYVRYLIIVILSIEERLTFTKKIKYDVFPLILRLILIKYKIYVKPILVPFLSPNTLGGK